MSKITTILLTTAVVAASFGVPLNAMAETNGTINTVAGLPEKSDFLYNPWKGYFRINSIDLKEGIIEYDTGWYKNKYDLVPIEVHVALPAYDVGMSRTELMEKAKNLGQSQDTNWSYAYKMAPIVGGATTKSVSGALTLEANINTTSEIDTSEGLLEANLMDTIFWAVKYIVPGNPEAGEYWFRGEYDYRSCRHHEHYEEYANGVCRGTMTGDGDNARVIYAVPGAGAAEDPLSWEDELKEIALGRVAQAYRELEAAETEVAAGRKVSEEVILGLQGNLGRMDLDFAKLAATELMTEEKAKYSLRIEELVKQNAVIVEQPAVPEEPVVTPTPGVPSVPGVSGGTAGALGTLIGGETTGNGGENGGGTGAGRSPHGLLMEERSAVVLGALDQTEASSSVQDRPDGDNERGEEEEGLDVPNLGVVEQSWLERYGLALLVAGAAATGVAGWWLIGLFGKRRKRKNY